MLKRIVLRRPDYIVAPWSAEATQLLSYIYSKSRHVPGRLWLVCPCCSKQSIQVLPVGFCCTNEDCEENYEMTGVMQFSRAPRVVLEEIGIGGDTILTRIDNNEPG